MKIVILDAKTLTMDEDIDFSIFDKFGDVTIYQLVPEDQISEYVKDADVILCNKAPMNERTLSKAKNLKYIGLFATGYNNIDIEYCKSRNITVCNAGGYSTNAVCQHTFSLIFKLYNKVDEYDTFVKNRGWIEADIFSPFMQMKEVRDKTIGIIGYGTIGKKVAQVAKAFDMKVMVYNRSAKPGEKDGIIYTDIPDILSKADIVSMHCPLNEDSYKMCNKEFFRQMKKDAIFINTARGGVVDERDLVWALENGEIKYAALDVIDVEPMLEDSILLNAPNLIITPHVAWAALETREDLVKLVSKNLEKYFAGTPINVIL